MTNLADLESRIKSIARRHSIDSHEREDLEQTARLTVWQILEGRPDASVPYLYGAVEKSILTVKRFDRAKKRNSGKKPISFHRIDGEGFAPEDFFSIDGDITQREKIEFLREFLTKKFGRAYFHKIKKGHKTLPAKIVRGLVEEIWAFELEEVPRKVSYELFVNTGMSGFLWTFYRNSPMRAIQDAYPDRFFEWEFNRVPNGFWDGEEGYKRGVEATRWLCEKHDVTSNEKKMTIGCDEFEDEGLGRMLHMHFNDSPFLALKAVFPSLSEWQAHQAPKGFYDDPSNHRTALDSLLLSIGMPSFSELTPEEIYDHNPRKIRQKHFTEYGMRGLLARYDKSIYHMFDAIYPGKTRPWFFFGHKGTKDARKMAADAVRWLFDDYLQISRDEIPAYATTKLFWRVGFSGILTRRDLNLNSSPFQAVNLAYPNVFNQDDFTRFRETRLIPGLKDFRSKKNGSKLA